MENFCIAVLTHDEPRSLDALKFTINNLYINTNFTGSIDIRMLLNGNNESIINLVNNDLIPRLCDSTKDKWFNIEFVVNETNNGCSAGVNQVNDLCRDYEYVMFLEGDWMLLPGYDNWLSECIEHISTTDTEIIYLRKFVSPYNMRQYGPIWAYDEKSLMGESTFRHISKPIYTNNPIIRKNKHFYSKGVYPLVVVENENKSNPNWGRAEIETERKCNSFIGKYYDFGCFVHFNEAKIDTGSYTPEHINNYGLDCSFGLEKCKFGFIASDDLLYCRCCRPNTIESYKSHNIRYMKLYHNEQPSQPYLVETDEEVQLAESYKNNQI